MALWPLLNDLIPQAVMQAQKCEETLSVALLVFRKLADTSIESVDVESCLLGWGSLLVKHKSQEVVCYRSAYNNSTNNEIGCRAAGKLRFSLSRIVESPLLVCLICESLTAASPT
jgi:hypothetical protein